MSTERKYNRMKLPFNTELLIKHLRSESKPQERILIENWLKNDRANEQFYEQFKRFWMGLDDDAEQISVNVDQAWLKTSDRLVTKKRIGIYKYVAAAVIVLGIITGAYRWWDYNQWVRYETGDGAQLYTLADGSQVQLNHHSSIAYRQKSGQRLVKMKGEVFFDVSRDEYKPFVINTSNAKVQVLGTSFNIRAREDALNERVYVESGKVAMEVKNSGRQMLLTQGQLGVLNKSEQSVQNVQSQTINDMAWRTRKINFENANSQDIIELIASVYNVKLRIDEAFSNRTINVDFDNQPVEEVLDVISVLLGGELIVEGDIYQIK
jgi:ferric-dicitrate binding protein FerR (iron transport regulator)